MFPVMRSVFKQAVVLLLFAHIHGERHIATGNAHTCVIKSPSWDLFCTGNATVASLPPPSGPFHAVTAGNAFTCGLWTNGSTVCWGVLLGALNGSVGQLFIPSSNGNPLEFLDISGRESHFCGLMYNGSVRCYGDNFAGACSAPDSVFLSITAGFNFTCGVLRDNSVTCWGAQDNPVMQNIPLGNEFAHVACGTAHACTILLNGSLLCFGGNMSGELASPAGNYSWVAAGHGFTCAIPLDSSRSICWGSSTIRRNMYVQEISCAVSFCSVIRDIHGVTRATGWITIQPNATQEYTNLYKMIDALIATTGTYFSTLVGSGQATFADGIGTSASFYSPYRLSIDASGNGIIYVADTFNNRIRRILPDLRVETLAGSGGVSFRDGIGVSAAFYNPYGVTNDGKGNVYVADTYNHRIRMIDSAGNVSTIAGNGTATKADGVGTAAAFFKPYAVVMSQDGYMYVSEVGNSDIRRVSISGVVTTIAGSGNTGYINGPATSAQFDTPFDLTMDDFGNIYVTDAGNFRIRKISSDGIVSTFAGKGVNVYIDATGTNAAFVQPFGIAVDDNGYVYVGDSLKPRIRRITPTGIVSTIAGTGTAANVDGIGTNAGFNNLCDVEVDASGYVYVVDAAANRIKVGIPQSTLTASLGNMPRMQQGYAQEDVITTWRMTSLSTSMTGYQRKVVDLEGCDIITSTVNANHTAGLNSGILTLSMSNNTGLSRIDTGGMFPRSMQHGPRTLWISFRELPPLSLSLPSLATVRLQGPVQLHADSFAGLPSMTCLNCAIPGTAGLAGMGVYSSGPGTLHLDTLQYLYNMDVIELQDNDITAFVPPSGSWSLPRVSTLRLCGGNNGTTLLFQAPDAFTAFPNIHTLSSDLPAITNVLDMRGCGISRVHPAAFGAIGDEIAGASLSGNAIANISDITAAFSSVFALGKVSSLDLSYNFISTVHFNDLDGFMGLQVLSLNFNNIIWVAESAFTSLKHPQLVLIDMGGNYIESNPCPAGYYNDIRVLLAGARAAACFLCTPGYYCPGDANSYPCAAGYFNDEPQQYNVSSCLPCPLGTSNALEGQTSLSCVLCQAGTASPSTAATSVAACVACKPGYYSGTPGNGECVACPAGTFSNATRAASLSACEPCPFNTYSDTLNAVSNATCMSCPTGLTTSSTGASTPAACVVRTCSAGHVLDSNGDCNACIPGTYASDGSCIMCPAGRYSAAYGAAVCSACPTGTFRSIPGGNDTAACLPCPLGTICRLDKTGCNAICAADTLLMQSNQIQNITAHCGTPTQVQQTAVCTLCEQDTYATQGVCIAGFPHRLPLLSAMLEPASTITPVNMNVVGSIPQSQVTHSTTEQFESCGKYVLSKLFTQPAAYFASVRTPILIATFAAAGLFLLCMSPWARNSGSGASKPVRSSTSPLPSPPISSVSLILRRMDAFATDHPEDESNRVRNNPTPSGGMFTGAFLIAALGMSISVLVQLATHTYMVGLSVINTPPKDFDSDMKGVHYGPCTVHLLLLGQYNDDTCGNVRITAASSSGWHVTSAQGVTLEAAATQFSLHDTLQQSSVLACHVIVSCDNCRLTSAASLSLAYDWTYQSAVVHVDTRAAYDSCTPAFTHAYSAPSASQLMASIRMDIQVLPVAFTYTGSLGSAYLNDATGHDLQLSSSAVAFMPDATLLRPDTDGVTLFMTFTPTPYSTLIVVTDAMDTMAVISSILGLVSGLSGGFQFLMNRWDDFMESKTSVTTLKWKK
jgi:hypothetical protein